MSDWKLPEGWHEEPLGSFVDHILGGEWGEPPEAVGGDLVDVGVVRGTEFRHWDVASATSAAPRRISTASLAKRSLRSGDLVVEVSGGGPTQPVGRVLLIDERALRSVGVPLVCSNFCRQMRLKAVDPGYVAAFLNHQHSRGEFDQFQKQTTNLRNLTVPAFLEQTVPLPPLPDQRRIVAKLDALRARSRRAKYALDAVPALLDRLRQSVLAAAFRGDLTADWREQHPDVEPASELLARIRIERRKRWEEAEFAKMTAKGRPPKDDAWKAKYVKPEPVDESGLPELPEGWCWTNVGTVAPLQPGYAFSSKGFVAVGIRLLKGINVRDGSLTADDLDHWPSAEARGFAAYGLQNEDIVIAMDRPVYSSGTRATKVAMLDATWNGALLLQRVGCFRRATELDSAYLFAFLRGSHFREHILRSQKGSQDGKDLPHVSGETIDAACIPLAPLAEQRAIAALLGEVNAGPGTLEAQVSAMRLQLSTLDTAILATAFRGELFGRRSVLSPAFIEATP